MHSGVTFMRYTRNLESLGTGKPKGKYTNVYSFLSVRYRSQCFPIITSLGVLFVQSTWQSKCKIY